MGDDVETLVLNALADGPKSEAELKHMSGLDWEPFSNILNGLEDRGKVSFDLANNRWEATP